MRNLLSLLVLCTVLIVGLDSKPSEAQEAACTALGANCVCSEPFQMTGFTNTSGSFYNPNDSTTKQCGEEVANHPISRNDADMEAITSADDATAFARMPAGNSVTRMFRVTPGNSGTFFVGGTLSSQNLGATYDARMSIRAYVYHSTDYNFRDETPPCHSKFLQGQVGAWHIENAFGELEMYQFTNGNWGTTTGTYFPRDCCSSLPGGAVGPPNHDEWKGHWFRTEVVLTKRAGPGVRHQLYMKDVTNGVTKWNNGDEALLVDWYGTASGIDPWTSDFNQQITSSPRQVPMSFNYYREVSPGGQCNGWRGLSHMMIAGWDTDSGQRIGAATEFEGSGGGGSSSTLVLIRVLNGIVIAGGLLQSLFVAGWFWQRRTVAVQAAVKFWRYASELPEMYWTYRYKKAVKKWQAQAPPMIEQRPTVIDVPKEQIKVERPWDSI